MASQTAPEIIKFFKRHGLSLYAGILRIHREKLPGEVRQLGDRVVKEEFRQMFKFPKSTEQQWMEFANQWTKYKLMLAGQGDQFSLPSSRGEFQAQDQDPSSDSSHSTYSSPDRTAIDPSGVLDEATIASMTPEQRAQLAKLHQEARRLGDRMMGRTGGAGAAPREE